MSESIRIVKFETKIEEIRKAITSSSTRTIAWMILGSGNPLETTKTSALIFESPLNAYAEIIRKNSIISLKNLSNDITNPWKEDYEYSSFEDPKVRIKAAKDFVRYCNMQVNREEAYKFIFWSLMILTVDDQEKEKYLSIICDFARMLHISDEEMEDIVTVIKIIYGNGEGKGLKTKIVKNIFLLLRNSSLWMV